MLKIGHRGAPGNPRYGENTLLSFEKAIWKGATALELDVRMTKDGTLVAIHDLAVDRTTNGHGNVCDMAYWELQELDAGFGEKIPMLHDVFNNFGSKVQLNVELKEKHIVRCIPGMVDRCHLHRSVLVSAFDTDDNEQDSSSSWDELESVCKNKVRFAFLASKMKINDMGINHFIVEAAKRGAFAVHPEYFAVTPGMVQKAHSAGLLLNIWTVNDLKEIKRFHEMGVDGICSDFPELL